MAELLFDTREAARFLGCSLAFARSLFESGAVECTKVGRTFLVDRMALIAYLEGMSNDTRSEESVRAGNG